MKKPIAIIPIILAMLFLWNPVFGYQIPKEVLSVGGTDGTSASYYLRATAGQSAVGSGSSANYRLGHGFWLQTIGPNCCMDWGLPGDANKDLMVNLTDILDAISYVYVAPLGQPQAADGCNALYDVNGDGASANLPLVNLTDILNMISHVYIPPNPALCCPPGCQFP